METTRRIELIDLLCTIDDGNPAYLTRDTFDRGGLYEGFSEAGRAITTRLTGYQL